MRIILPYGRVNILNLAKNAGTSVDQIERFYAKHPHLSREMAKNLQSVRTTPSRSAAGICVPCGRVTLLAVCGSNHRESYFDIVMVAVVSALIGLAVASMLETVFGSF